MKQRIFPILTVIALLLAGASLVYSYLSRPKIGYIKSNELFEGYAGMKEAKMQYEKKIGTWQANLDTLSKDYQISLNRFNQEYSRLNTREKEERRVLLSSQLQNLEQYKQNLEEKVAKEDESLTQGIYHQVNTYIKQYGDAQGYTLILGTTNNGNILYGKDYSDLTAEVLKGLNETYKGTATK